METNQLIQFVREKFNTPENFIPLHEPRFVGNDKKYVLDAIDSTFVSSVGAFVDLFEKMMCEITGAKYCVATVNGTAALHAALILSDVNPDDEVLSQPLTFVATANAISYQHAHSHFVDVDIDTMGMSPVALQKRLEEIAEMRDGKCFNKETNRQIKACVPMHTFGLPCRIDEIKTICDQYNIILIEDAAESLGSYYKDQHTGTFGKIGTFSFNGNKTVTCGGGGAIVTNNEEVAKLAKYITTTAKKPHKWEYVHDRTGYNYRMPNLNAAMACAQLEVLNKFIENKRELHSLYQDFFKDNNAISLISEVEEGKANYWLNAVRFKNLEERNKFLEETNSAGIMTRPIWQLMNKLSMFNNCPKGPLTNAESLEKTIVNIPSSVRI